MEKNGKCIIFSAPSGSGKSTIVQWLMAEHPELRLAFSISATSRPPRGTEQHGVEYFFLSPEEFRSRIAAGEFLEYDEHNKNYYGTPRAQAQEKMESAHVLLDIEPKGAKQVKDAAADAVLIFIMPPNVEELERRLRGRGDTPEEQIRMRMERAVWEMEQRSWYDHVVVNDDAQRCAEEILSILSNLK